MSKQFGELIDKVVNSVTLDEVLNQGEVIEDSGEHETYYSDCPGGEFTQLKIVKYDGKLYVYKEKVIENKELNQKRECVSFYELK